MNKPTAEELANLKAVCEQEQAKADEAAQALNSCLHGRGYFGGIPSNDEERAIWNRYDDVWKAANERAREARHQYMAAFDAFHASDDPDAAGGE